MMTARSIFAMVVPSWAIVGSNVAHSADWVKVTMSPAALLVRNARRCKLSALTE
jgi:hypothetical protein